MPQSKPISNWMKQMFWMLKLPFYLKSFQKRTFENFDGSNRFVLYGYTLQKKKKNYLLIYRKIISSKENMQFQMSLF